MLDVAIDEQPEGVGGCEHVVEHPPLADKADNCWPCCYNYTDAVHSDSAHSLASCSATCELLEYCMDSYRSDSYPVRSRCTYHYSDNDTHHLQRCPMFDVDHVCWWMIDGAEADMRCGSCSHYRHDRIPENYPARYGSDVAACMSHRGLLHFVQPACCAAHSELRNKANIIVECILSWTERWEDRHKFHQAYVHGYRLIDSSLYYDDVRNIGGCGSGALERCGDLQTSFDHRHDHHRAVAAHASLHTQSHPFSPH